LQPVVNRTPLAESASKVNRLQESTCLAPDLHAEKLQVQLNDVGSTQQRSPLCGSHVVSRGKLDVPELRRLHWHPPPPRRLHP